MSLEINNPIALRSLLEGEIFQLEKIEKATAAPSAKSESQSEHSLVIICSETSFNAAKGASNLMLEKMIAAVGLDITKEIIVSTQILDTPDLTSLTSQYSFDKVLGFGVSPSQLGIKNRKHYEVINHSKYTMLFCDELSKIEADKLLKMTLWNALKIQFNIEK
jgi:hypothetical protein